MNQPTVCAVMLTADRHELAAKAVACFLRQTYPNKALLIYDTGKNPLTVELPDVAHALSSNGNLPIGALRNNMNRMVAADIILHWDDDDWSHPNRISEQVALLQESGAECVGYNEMLFWHYLSGGSAPEDMAASAWLYSNRERTDYALGTSLCYWRKTWEEKQFRDDLPKPDGTGEDHQWIQEMKVCACSSLIYPQDPEPRARKPRMIARIHGRNSSHQYDNLEKSPSWKRVSEWDARVRELLA